MVVKDQVIKWDHLTRYMTLKGTETLFTSHTCCHETHNYVVCTRNTLQTFSPNDTKLIDVQSLHGHSNAVQVSHTQWCIISEMNPFTYGGLTCPANHSFCLEVTEDFSMGQIDILGRTPQDAEVSPWWEDTFYEHGTQALVATMDLVQKVILQTEYHLSQVQVETNLKCESFCNSILLMINNVKTMSELTSIGKWEWVKFNVKKIAIKEGKQIANARKFRQTTILSRLNFFSNKDILSKSEEKELYTLQSELDDFYTEKAKGAFIRSRARWIEEGEKNSSYFFNLEKQKQALKTINRLSIDNCISQEKTQIDDYIYSFYNDLYKSKFSESDCDLFFSFLKDRVPIIDSDFRNMMDADIEISELDTAIKQMSNGKSPGIDGITVELYKHFWHEIRILVFEALKECIDKAELSPSMKHGLIILAPKSNKDKLFLDNWRPITLLCNDFKLLSHVFANRLKKGIGEIISETQSAFIKGRSIHSHIRLVLDMLDYNSLIPQTNLLLFLDFFKAFDTLEHSFLFRSLETFGFGPMFCKVISVFYNNIFSSVSLNVGSSPRIQIKRGIRQRCPVSPILFNLAVELMSLFIKNSKDNLGIEILGRTFTISQFADDTLLFLKNKEVYFH
uniref:Reverse transcriptase domain-containing protein n=1 Tax=Cyprinus carpio TaxID=7962 RepID=A0A8C2CG96_CYPCA